MIPNTLITMSIKQQLQINAQIKINAMDKELAALQDGAQVFLDPKKEEHTIITKELQEISVKLAVIIKTIIVTEQELAAIQDGVKELQDDKFMNKTNF